MNPPGQGRAGWDGGRPRAAQVWRGKGAFTGGVPGGSGGTGTGVATGEPVPFGFVCCCGTIRRGGGFAGGGGGRNPTLGPTKSPSNPRKRGDFRGTPVNPRGLGRLEGEFHRGQVVAGRGGYQLEGAGGKGCFRVPGDGGRTVRLGSLDGGRATLFRGRGNPHGFSTLWLLPGTETLGNVRVWGCEPFPGAAWAVPGHLVTPVRGGGGGGWGGPHDGQLGRGGGPNRGEPWPLGKGLDGGKGETTVAMWGPSPIRGTTPGRVAGPGRSEIGGHKPGGPGPGAPNPMQSTFGSLGGK